MQLEYVGFWVMYTFEDGLGGTLSVGLNGSPFSAEYALARWTDTSNSAIEKLMYIGFTAADGAAAKYGVNCVLLDTPLNSIQVQVDLGNFGRFFNAFETGWRKHGSTRPHFCLLRSNSGPILPLVQRLQPAIRRRGGSDLWRGACSRVPEPGGGGCGTAAASAAAATTTTAAALAGPPAAAPAVPGRLPKRPRHRLRTERSRGLLQPLGDADAPSGGGGGAGDAVCRRHHGAALGGRRDSSHRGRPGGAGGVGVGRREGGANGGDAGGGRNGGGDLGRGGGGTGAEEPGTVFSSASV